VLLEKQKKKPPSETHALPSLLHHAFTSRPTPRITYSPLIHRRYLTVNEAQDTKYFYWFAECDGCDSATAPVALWTNGGPGCSGLIGFMTEQGPFRPTADGALAANPYAWNKVANYLFIEQPVGVGFSYSTTSAAYNNVGDDQAAALNFQLMVKFLERFPQYHSNEFYISAESYGGHYMPTLAKHIVVHDPLRAKINFAGLAVGNPCVRSEANVILFQTIAPR